MDESNERRAWCAYVGEVGTEQCSEHLRDGRWLSLIQILAHRKRVQEPVAWVSWYNYAQNFIYSG
jgi:hypothetical protein